jgi:hypothetical protein
MMIMWELAIWNFHKIVEVLQKHLNYLLADYGPSTELHAVYIIWLYMHISVQGRLPRILYSILMGNLGIFQGNFYCMRFSTYFRS